MSTSELLHLTGTLSTRDWTQFDEEDFADIALFVASDGCTGVPDFYLNECILHDWFYATHRDFYGRPVTQHYADSRMKKNIQKKSWFGKWSPMAWWRYRALRKWFRVESKKAWDKKEN